jgi:Bardet-Biedl syndrome 1 protein
MTVCDLKNDNYFKLIAAEIPFDMRPPRLRVYKGNQVVSDQALPGIPSSVQHLFIDEIEPKMPSKFLNKYEIVNIFFQILFR